MDILKGLNDKQKEAVLATEGPVLILAGAGSGKTRALTHRIAYLIREKGVSPQNILAVTFTNKAANEMRGRVEKLLSGGRQPSLAGKLFWLGTFHSICVKILRREIERSLGYPRDFTIYDASDSLRAIKRAMKSLDVSEKQYNPRAIQSFISQAKGELISADAYRGFAFEHFQKVVARVYEEYDKLTRRSGALDFDDLILKTVEIFERYPAVLKKYQGIFRYILVDEYQDTNHAQYVFLKFLAQKRRDIFAIGDDWQSIYSFRGAKFQNILDFKKDYPEAKVIYLEENYRSSAPILAAAQEVIKKNETRSDKNLFTRGRGGAPVAVCAFADKFSEVEFILEEILSLGEGEGRRLSDFVVLYRTNAQSRLFEERLIRRNLPYRIFGSLRFYERKEIKDALAYLNLLVNPSDFASLSRAVAAPPRGIGEKTLEIILSAGREAEDLPKAAKAFFALIEDLRSSAERFAPERLVEEVLDKTGLREYYSDKTVESETRLENLEELKSAAGGYESLSEFLEAVSLVSDIDNYSEAENALTLMTVHAAKGLEFPVVFISGMEEGVFPHSQSLDDQFGLEEERRLLYVGMTRAKQRLYLAFSRSRMAYGRLEISEPSRFLEEIPSDKIDLLEI